MEDSRVRLLIVLEKHFEVAMKAKDECDDAYETGQHNAFLEALNLCRTIRATMTNSAEGATKTP